MLCIEAVISNSTSLKTNKVVQRMSTNGPSRSLESAAKRRPFRAFFDMPGLYLFVAVETPSRLVF